MTVTIRTELPGDEQDIRMVTEAAFAKAEHSDGIEGEIVDRLRAAGDLSLSLVAVNETGSIIGHVALSPVTISDGASAWFGLGPVSVDPNHQGAGVGSRLIRDSIAALKAQSAAGIVLLGDPGYYCRFGFKHDPLLRYPGPPPEFFQRLVLNGDSPCGEVSYCAAFRA